MTTVLSNSNSSLSSSGSGSGKNSRNSSPIPERARKSYIVKCTLDKRQNVLNLLASMNIDIYEVTRGNNVKFSIDCTVQQYNLIRNYGIEISRDSNVISTQ